MVSVDITKLRIDVNSYYEIWTGKTGKVEGSVSETVASHGVALYKLTRN